MVMRIDCNTHKEALCINDNFCDVLHVSTILFIVLWFGHCVSMDIHAFTLMMRQTNSQFNFFFRLRHRFEMKFVRCIVCIISLEMEYDTSKLHISNVAHINNCLEYVDKSQ